MCFSLSRTPRCPLIIFSTMLGLVLIACSDGSDRGSSGQPGAGEPVALENMMPASSRGFFAVSLEDENNAQEIRQWLAGDGAVWRQQPSDILRWLDVSGELVANATELLLVQVTVSGEEFALLASLDAETSDALLDQLGGVELDDYQGYPMWSLPDSGLVLSVPDAQTWITGPQVAVERVLDVRAGSAAGIDQSEIAPYIVDSEDPVVVNFVYGLPALYGEVESPGNGDSSLNQARAISGALDFNGGTWQGSIQFNTANAQVYTPRLIGLLPEGAPVVFEAVGEVVAVDVGGMTNDDLFPLFKSMLHGMNAVDYAEAVTHGGNAPWLNFDVGENPNSIFINFQFKNDAAREAFAAEHLPDGFTLAPLAILRNEARRYFLVLNIYQSSGGLVEGARAEWSVFVNDPETDEPRFLVLQAAAENFSVDSVNLLVPPEPVSHVLEPDAIVSYVGVVDEDTGDESTYFASRIDWPLLSNTYLSREFTVANDFIFWGNGVADRGLYNGTVHERQVWLVSDSRRTLEDNSRWAPYLHHEAVHAFVYQNPLEIVISPWWNLDEEYLDVTEDYRQELIDFKNGFYPSTVLGLAEAAMQGQRPALATSTTVGPYDSSYGNPPAEGVDTAYYHFTIRDADALLDYLGVAGRYTPLAIPYYGTWGERFNQPIYEDEEPRMYLTLAVYQLAGDPCGARAEWQMVVQNEEGRASTLRLETLSNDACLNPVSLLGLSARVWQRFESGRGITALQWTTGVASAFSVVEVSGKYVTPPYGNSDEAQPSQAWVAAGDEVCSLNGVCNANFYDGMTLSQPLLRMSTETIEVYELETPFDDFIDSVPAEVTIRQKPAILGTNPWVNVPVFGTQ